MPAPDCCTSQMQFYHQRSCLILPHEIRDQSRTSEVREQHVQHFCLSAQVWPIERTLLVTGVLDAAMTSHAEGGKHKIETPHLAGIAVMLQFLFSVATSDCCATLCHNKLWCGSNPTSADHSLLV